MKIISFNANGIRSAASKGFYEWLAQQDADFVCIQETKAQIDQLQAQAAIYFPQGFFCEYAQADKKGYSGVAIYSKHQPLAIRKNLDYSWADTEGRYIQFDYPKLSVVSIYLPSGTSGEVRQTIKFEFLEWFAQHLHALKNEGRELIICGDYNIAHQNIDLKNWRGNQKNSGFLPQERAWLDVLFGQMGFIDAFRVRNQLPDQYTWWSNRGQAWAKNVGWRIDYQVITQGLMHSVAHVDIFKEQRFSDHAPLLIEYQGDWYA